VLASRNHARLVYDGDQSQFTATVPVPSGSAEIEDAFQQAFAAQNLSYDDTEFSGRSDYQAFFKTPEQVALFGGTAGQAFDPNYHTAGDTIANLNVVGASRWPTRPPR
jgi:hypothetical protein